MGGLSDFVYYNSNSFILSPSVRKTNNEFNINVLPFQNWNLNNLSKTATLKMLFLNLFTIRTLGQKIYYVSLHFIVPKHFQKIRVQFSGTCINGILGVLSFSKDILPKQYHIRNT